MFTGIVVRFCGLGVEVWAVLSFKFDFVRIVCLILFCGVICVCF